MPRCNFVTSNVRASLHNQCLHEFDNNGFTTTLYLSLSKHLTSAIINNSCSEGSLVGKHDN